MAEQSKPQLVVPGLEPVPYVVVKLPSGQIVLRHPSEVQPLPGQTSPKRP